MYVLQGLSVLCWFAAAGARGQRWAFSVLVCLLAGYKLRVAKSSHTHRDPSFLTEDAKG